MCFAIKNLTYLLIYVHDFELFDRYNPSLHPGSADQNHKPVGACLVEDPEPDTLAGEEEFFL